MVKVSAGRVGGEPWGAWDFGLWALGFGLGACRERRRMVRVEHEKWSEQE
jgi:hypothetical protein